MNLALEQRHRPLLDEFRQHLAAWCRQTGDRFTEHYSHPGCAMIPGIGYVPVEQTSAQQQ